MENSYDVPIQEKLDMLKISEEELLRKKQEEANRSKLGEELAALVKTDEEYARYKGYID